MTEPSANPVSLSAEPPVRPFWWLKRLSLTGGALLLLLAITWVLWDQYSRRELQARLDAYHQAGEPTAPEHLQPASVPDENNAALLYGQAAGAVSSKAYCPSASSYVFGGDLPYRPEWHALTKRVIELNVKPLELARQASRRAQANWGTRFSSPLISALPGMLAPQRNLANLLGDAALYEHFQGDDSQAVADVRTLLHQGRSVGSDPFLISRLVGGGIDALAIARLEIMTGDLRIAQDSSSGQSTGELSREQVHSLIVDLLGGRQDAQSMAQATRAERVFALDSLNTFFGSSLLLKPVFRLDTTRSLDRDTEIAAACVLPTLPAARAAIRPPTPMEQQLRNTPSALSFLTGTTSAQPIDPAFRTRLLATMTMAPDRVPAMVQRAICERRIAAVMLASRMYALDHGLYPATLQDLVPKYLPALPADPMAADDRTFGYFIAADGKRPVLYSVGEDGIDQAAGGKANLSPHLLTGWQHISKGQPDDQYRDLSAWVNPEPRPPMTDKPTDYELGLAPEPATQPDAPLIYPDFAPPAQIQPANQ